MGRTLAPFATSGYIPAYGFGDAKTGDWSVFKLKFEGECRDFDEVLRLNFLILSTHENIDLLFIKLTYIFRVYNQITPTISLSGPTNFAPLIYQAIEICEKVQDVSTIVFDTLFKAP